MRKEAKPIFTVGIPNTNMNEISATTKLISDSFSSDYFVLVFPIVGDNPEIKVFYEKDFNEVKYEELKQIITDAVK